MSRLRTAGVLLVLLLVHITVFAHVRPLGVAPDVLILAAVIGGTVGGGDYGARHGFVAGLLFDLMAPAAPFGLAAGVYGSVGYGAGLFARAVDSEDPRVVPATAGLGSFVGIAGYGVGLGVLGAEQYVEWRLLWVALAASIYNVFLAVPVQLMYRWVAAGERPRARTETGRSVVN